MKFQLVKMVESIGAISLLGRVPVYGVCYGKDLSSKRKAIDVCGMPSADFRGSEDRRIPKDFQYQIETDVDRKPGKWPPANKPENPALHIRLAPSSLLVKRSCTSEENGFSEGGDLSSVARRNL
ncbi:putative glutamate--cysteine ligase, chloroplastic-like [Capsicum annuum]|nr:putative glutamate--cysteine ligase, chloroplastic-like [Capsicum annuum]